MEFGSYGRLGRYPRKGGFRSSAATIYPHACSGLHIADPIVSELKTMNSLISGLSLVRSTPVQLGAHNHVRRRYDFLDTRKAATTACELLERALVRLFGRNPF